MNFVSIVLTSYNKEKYILDQLNSLITQTHTNWELIVVDDCSTDSSVSIIQKFIAEHPNLRIQFNQNEANVGVGKTFENGLKLASGDYIAVCDADDVWTPNKIELELAYLVQ